MHPAISVRNLVKVYNPTVRALDGVDLDVQPGRVFALLGPNGAGKTTLMRILTTQIKATSGQAEVFGRDVDLDDFEVRRMIGYVPQEMSVWTDITAYENLKIYAKIYGLEKKREEIINEALDRMSLLEAKDRLVNTYSGGMIRRLEIACALIVKPKILFLDEPTIGLDPSARKKVWEKIISFTGEFGATVFFTTHYMDEADEFSDDIAIINNGRIVGRGNSRQLKDSVGNEEISIKLAVAKDCLKLVENIRGVTEAKQAGVKLNLLVKDVAVVLPAVITALAKHDVGVVRAETSKPTLDDVFTKYAGAVFDRGTSLGEVKGTRKRIHLG